MMSGKNYKAKGRTQRQPIWFSVDGQRFDCRPTISGTVLSSMASRFARLAEIGDADELTPEQLSEVAIVLDDFLAFFEATMSPDEYAKFRAYADDAESEIEIDLLGEIVIDLIKAYGPARPLASSSPSVSGPKPNGITSTDAPSFPESNWPTSQPRDSSASSTP